MIESELSAFHRPTYWLRLTAFFFILRSWFPTHSNVNIISVLDFYSKQQFVCQPNISKNLFANVQQKFENTTFNQKVAYIQLTQKR
jgi:hypothetical protein